MKMTGDTIFITGGGSGIGRGLAEALHAKGNQIIISGRRKAMLDETTKANPGMASVELDVEDLASIAAVAKQLIVDYPALNVLINNAGIMKVDTAATAVDDVLLTSTITTNLLGPIRMTSALIEHLKAQPAATVINVTSGLAFMPLASSSVYCATKAALHSFTMSQRWLLKDTGVRVLELAPPYVQTDLMNGANDPLAMPLQDFIEQTMALLAQGGDEVMIENVMARRKNQGPNEYEAVTKFNDMMKAHGR